MTLAMAPLIVLFELSILLARWIERMKPVADDDDTDDEYDAEDAYDGADGAGEEFDFDFGLDEDGRSGADIDPPKLQDPEPKD
jgi:hypothetical protein